MHIHLIQHVSFEGPGAIAMWADIGGHSLEILHPYRTNTLPDSKDVEVLILMGGPMSVHDEPTHPWLVNEKHLLRNVIAEGKPVLGVCLGAQLIAEQLGAAVTPANEKEFGWFPVYSSPHDSPIFASFPEKLTVLHWHGEQFDLPDGAIRIAQNSACPIQAFEWAGHVAALQFHLEMTSDSLDKICGASASDLGSIGRFVAREYDIRNSLHYLGSCHRALYAILNTLTGVRASLG